MAPMNAILDEGDGVLRFKLMQSLIAKAGNGDMAAMRLILERTDPVAAQNLTINNNVGTPNDILDTLAQLRAKVANGKGAKPGCH